MNRRIKNPVFEAAKINTSDSNSFTFSLAKVLIPSNKLPYFYCWYAYFRWVDDISDSHDVPLKKRLSFIEAQINLVERIYLNFQSLTFNEMGECYLQELITFDKNSGEVIKIYIIQMLQCIQFDIKRVGEYSTFNQLITFFNKEVLSYLNTFQFFCSSSKTYLAIKTSPEGIAGKWAHILRDFVNDNNQKIYNLPHEDILKYDLYPFDNTDFLKDNCFKNWVKDRIEEAENKFTEGKLQIKNHPSLRFKILITMLCFKYQSYLNVIKTEKYILRDNYKITNASIVKTLPSLLLEVSCLSLIHVISLLKLPGRK